MQQQELKVIMGIKFCNNLKIQKMKNKIQCNLYYESYIYIYILYDFVKTEIHSRAGGISHNDIINNLSLWRMQCTRSVLIKVSRKKYTSKTFIKRTKKKIIKNKNDWLSYPCHEIKTFSSHLRTILYGEMKRTQLLYNFDFYLFILS
jgi:hypothetical protein